jgi:hypothetical protein
MTLIRQIYTDSKSIKISVNQPYQRYQRLIIKYK